MTQDEKNLDQKYRALAVEEAVGASCSVLRQQRQAYAQKYGICLSTCLSANVEDQRGNPQHRLKQEKEDSLKEFIRETVREALPCFHQ